MTLTPYKLELNLERMVLIKRVGIKCGIIGGWTNAVNILTPSLSSNIHVPIFAELRERQRK